MRISLLGGTYQARSIIASAQECLNLYPERNPQDAEAPVTHQLTPGTVLHVVPPHAGVARGIYTATNGRLYYICGQNVYYIDSNFVVTQLGSLITTATTPVSMIDNGNAVVIVDGTVAGFAIDLASNSFAQINDPNFLGADRVDYVDTFLVFNQPGTKNFYSSLSNVTFAQLTAAGGVLGGTLAGGSLYTNGTYTGVALTGGAGSGAQATITVSGAAVTAVTITAPGLNYHLGDVLSATAASIGGTGSGFTYTLAAQSNLSGAFDPTYVAAKTGFPDQLATLCCVHREIWLFGIVKTTEVWYDAGGAAFPFAIMPGVFIEHGCAAKYSVCKHDLSVFWLSIDQEGQGTVFMGSGYRAVKISTPAIANSIAQYATISDAIGMMYKQGDHVFYVLTFPTADVTWVYDLSEGLWHQRGWLNPDTGLLHRWRPQVTAVAYGLVLAGDWENGNLYELSLTAYADAVNPTTLVGTPILRRRAFPHLVADGKRASYDRFAADVEAGNGSVTTPTVAPQLQLEWSDNRGRTYGTQTAQSLGAQGEYLVQPQWRQLGMARDRVFRLSWSADCKTALNGAWIDVTLSDS